MNCTGCMNCRNICPVGAIKIVDTGRNFIQKIDSQKCIECEKCKTVCHLNSTELSYPREVYVAESRFFDLKKHGASGGIASTIYKFGIENGYCCVGVIYENGRFIYSFINDIVEIKKASGSKYVISHLNGIHEQLNENISAGKKIMFVGLPCHCAAMKKMLRDMSRKVVWIDLVCNGVCPESLLFEDLKNNNVDKDKIFDIRFREKNNQYGITARNENWDIIKRVRKKDDIYMQEYEKKTSVYEHCVYCEYARTERVGDITLKDFVWKYGVSNIIINTEKGKDLLEKISKYIYIKKYSLEKAIEEDERFWKKTSPILSQNK